MKACTDPELMAALVGNVKIIAAGLTQLKQKQKKGKKRLKMVGNVEIPQDAFMAVLKLDEE